MKGRESMRARVGRLSREEAGQSIITIGLMSVFILTILAIVIDTGFIYMQRRNLQNAADAAALAGAQELNGTQAGYDAAVVKAQEWANKNVSGLKSFAAEPIDNYTGIRVTVHKDSNGHILGSISSGDKDVGAKAAAKVLSQNLPGKGVVPIGVEYNDYLNTTPGVLLDLKDKKMDEVTSNAGFVQLPGDNGDSIRDGLKYGSDVPLQPQLNTEPGNKLGQATENKNSGLQVRLSRALQHNQPHNLGKQCYTWEDIQPPTTPGAVWDCSPFNATESDGVQATAVVLLPVIVEDFTQFSGTKKIDLSCIGGGTSCSGKVYLLAYFWIDGNSTYVNPATGNYTTNPANTKGAIWGKFLANVPTQLTTYKPDECKKSDSCGFVPFDPNSVLKIVQLVE